MSSPQFVELRGIPGTAVAAKAQLYVGARERSLLFFLQSVSMEPHGLRYLAREIIRSEKLRSIEDEVTNLLVEVCLDPKIRIELREELSATETRNHRDDDTDQVKTIVAAVERYRCRLERSVVAEFAMTAVAQQVFDTMNYALTTGRMAVIEGLSGTGKSTAAETWAAANRGRARLISLSGISHKTGFFQKLASAIGLAASNRKATDMQVKVEEFFRRTKLLLAIDEAHYLWPQHQRSHSNPELIDWVNTALVNHGVPVVLICTDQFAKLKRRVEKQTGWTSEQLEHRVKRYVKLPPLPSREDLELVASKLLAARWRDLSQQWISTAEEPSPDLVGAAVGYALTCKLRLPAVADLAAEARLVARDNGRTGVTGRDLKRALLWRQLPSDQALREAFEPEGTNVARRLERRTQTVYTPSALKGRSVASAPV